MTHRANHEKYGVLFNELTEEDVESAAQFLSSIDTAAMEAWTSERIEIPEIGDQRFRMVVDRGEDEQAAVIVGGEFGNGITPWALARARIVRDMVNPDATLIYQPNTTVGQPNMNFSSDERRTLHEGGVEPFHDRLDIVLDRANAPDDLTFYGPSQGGVVALSYATKQERPVAVAVVETPNVANRSQIELLKDFAGSGSQLKQVIQDNYEHPENIQEIFAKETLEGLSIAGMTRFVRGILKADNRAIAGILRRDVAKAHMATILDNKGSIVHSYGTANSVSPIDANRAITQDLSPYARYQGVEMAGADHSISNHYALNGALARAARNLLRVS
jgi:hypothetical protein